MSQPNSYISNFSRPGSSLGRRAHVAIWVAVWLVAIDVFINLAFGFPTNPKAIPSRLQLYFNYGRSQEGKLSQITRADPKQTAPITLNGWYDPIQVEDLQGDPLAPVVTFYGMSHAVRLASALKRVSNRYHVRIVAAPGATTNWAYGAYLRDHGGNVSRVVVLAFMSGNLPMINTMSAMTWNTNVAIPYTSDRFYLDGDKLKRATPPYTSFGEYVRAFFDKKLWAASQAKFRKWDAYYNSFIMDADVLDRSAFVRLLRRAYAQREQRDLKHSVLDHSGFNPQSEEIKVAQKIVREFAADARRRNIVPVVFIANLLGDSDYLFEALEPALRHDNIPYLSSHTIASPNDPRSYLPDTHFTIAKDDEMAGALVKILDRQLASSDR
jgi:hypothetical protein